MKKEETKEREFKRKGRIFRKRNSIRKGGYRRMARHNIDNIFDIIKIRRKFQRLAR